MEADGSNAQTHLKSVHATVYSAETNQSSPYQEEENTESEVVLKLEGTELEK